MQRKFKILVADGVSPRGVELLSSISTFEVVESKPLKEEELLAKIADIDALIVRSQTKVSAKVLEKAQRLQVIGRAGVGVDNVDVEAATERGVMVMNTPGGSTISTAEHAFSLMLALARNISQADQSVRQAKWDRKNFQGVQIYGKVLGIIGMGRIGSEFAKRAQAFGMQVFAYDPYLSAARAKGLGVELFETLEDLLPRCDFLTMHMPLTDETRGILNKRTLALCKPSVRIVNCARGGLIDEAALLEFLEQKKLAGAALDVFEEEPLPENFPLRSLTQVVMTPHLGASTEEAQENVGIEIAESVRDLLLHGVVSNAVNMPSVDSKTLQLLRPYLRLCSQLGQMLAQLAPPHTEHVTIAYHGRIGEQNTMPLTRAALKGFLRQASGSSVNEVNVLKYAERRGLRVSELRESEAEDFLELIALKAEADGKAFEIAGTFFGASPRIVRINEHPMEIEPQGVLLIIENKDRPGMVGSIGTLLGKHGVNIANMSLSRTRIGGYALCVLNVDSAPPAALLEEFKTHVDIRSATTVLL